jgi:putative flippase GtrA
MKKHNGSDYKVCFSGATISKTEANRIGLSLIISSLFMLFLYVVFDVQERTLIFIISFAAVFISYFCISKKIFKEK